MSGPPTPPPGSNVSGPPPASRRVLSLSDATSLLIGIVVGTAIFKAPKLVYGQVHSPVEGLGLWLVGGVIAFAGALCYAELAAAFPRSGGDYEYLSRAYGRWLGLQFTIAQLVIVLTGSVGSMAYAFADYARAFLAWPETAVVWLALGAIGVLTATNLIGLRAGAATQNSLTAIKLIGLSLIVLLALGSGHWSHVRESVAGPRGVGQALVHIFYAYAGWTHAAYVAAEVNQPQRNLPRALLCGVGAVTLLYLIVNLAYVLVLGFDGVRQSATPAADVLRTTLGDGGARLVSLLVMLSALGAINGTILTGAYLLAELGRDHRAFRWLRRTDASSRPPVRSLLLQSVMAASLVVGVGTATGRREIDRVLELCGGSPVPWETYYGGFDTLVAASAPLFWCFLLLTGTSHLVLRWREPDRPRPFRTPGYPLTPFVFCGASLYMLWASVAYAGNLAWIGLLPISIAAMTSLTQSRDHQGV